MAGTTERQAPDAKHYVEYEEYVDFQLEKTRSNIKRTDILTTLTTLAVALVAYLLVFVVFDQWVIEGGFGYAARVGLLCVLATIVLGVATWRVLWPLLRRVHPLYAARVIEQSDPNLKSNLVNFVDVRQSNVESAPVVLKAMQKRAAVELSHIDVEEAVDHRPLLRIAYALLAVVVVSALYIIFSPKDPFASVRRALLPTAAIEVATETTISDVTPGDKDVPARTILMIEADVRGKEADRVQILFSTADHKYVDQPVEMRRIDENLPRFRGVLNGENGRGLLQSLTYRLIAGDAKTRDFAINVIQPPSARVDDVHYAFPAYMQFEEKTTQGGHIDGWEGATVTVHATTNMPVKRATIILTDTEDNSATGKEEVTMQVTDTTKLSANWKLDIRDDGSSPHYYHIQVKTENGETDPDPTQYTLRIRPDQRPEVTLLAPTGDLNAPANGIIPLVIQAVDPDFQLRSITLKAENKGEALRDQRLFADPLDTQAFRGKHDFQLEPLGLKAGDVVQFWIEAKDNKTPTANRGTTPRIQVTIGKPASAQEIKENLAREKEKQQDQIARDDANQSKADEQRAPQPGKEDDADKSDRRPDPPAPGEERPKNDKHEQDDNTASAPRNDDQERQKPQKPDRDDFQQQLQKLMQKEEEKKAGEKNQEEQQEKEQQQPQEKGDRGNEQKNQKSADGSKGKSQKNDSAGQKSKGSDNEQQQPNGQDGQQDKSGGQGKSNDKKDQTSKSQNQRPNDREKPGPSKSKPNEDQKNPGDQGSDKSDDAGQPGKGKPSKDGNQPGDKSEDQNKKEGGKNDAAKQDGAGKDDGDKNRDQTSKDGPSKSDKPAADPDKPASDEKSATEQKNQKDGGAGKDQADQSDPASNSKDPSKGKGSPSKSDKPEGDEQAGDGDGQKSKKTGEGREKPGKDSGDSGQEKPADDSPDAVKKKATGEETGDATGDEEGDPQAPKAKNTLNKKPDSKQGAKNPSADSDPDAKKSAQQRKPEDGTKSRNDDAEKAQRAPDGKKDTEQSPGQIDDPSSEPRPDLKKDGTEKRPGKPPEGGNQPQKGQGRKDGQKADGAETGEEGSSTATDQGKKGGNKTGAGDKSDEPGDTDPSAKKTGQPGSKKGDGSTTRPADKEGTKENGPGEESGNKPSTKGDKGKPGDKSGESPDGKSSDGKSAGKDDGGKPGDQKGPAGDGKSGDKQGEQNGKGSDGKSDSKPGKGKSDGQSSQPGAPGKTGTQRTGAGANLPPGKGDEPAEGGNGPSDAEAPKPREDADDEPPPPQDEEARLDFARKASNLVLNRLKGQLERGEVDQELLDELGWKNKADMKRFVEMLEQGLKDTGDDNSPEAIARRLQFEEMLKSMKLGNETSRRKGGVGAARTIQQIGKRDVPVPPEYQKLVESYTRSLSKQAEKPADKAAADKDKKKPAGK
jgi:hypothetical protein